MPSSPSTDQPEPHDVRLADSGIPADANGHGRIQKVRSLRCRLPGRAVSAAMLVNGELWVILDPSKGDAANSARRMLAALGPHVAALAAHIQLML